MVNNHLFFEQVIILLQRQCCYIWPVYCADHRN